MKQNILISDSCRDIDTTIACKASTKEFSVCVNYKRDRISAEGVVREMKTSGVGSFPAKADISLEDEVVRFFENYEMKLGHLAALVNNAGGLDLMMRVDQMSVERIQRIFSITLPVPYFVLVKPLGGCL